MLSPCRPAPGPLRVQDIDGRAALVDGTVVGFQAEGIDPDSSRRW